MELETIKKELSILIEGKFEQLTSTIAEQMEKMINQKFTDLENKFNEKIEYLETKVKQSEGEISNLQQNILKLQNDQDEQKDRHLRSTLIFKKIPLKGNENSWEDTTDKLANTINRHCPELGIGFLKRAIERCHRNIKNDRIVTENNRNTAPSISTKLLSWKDANEVLSKII